VPEVAVVIPAANPGSFLKTALESVLAQTFTDWEAVVVDDGSSEDLSWIRELDPRVDLIVQPRRGPSAARNAAIAATSGPLLAFLDADDLWMPTKVDAQVARMREFPETNLVDTEFERIDDTGSRIGRGFSGHHRTYLDLLGGCGICLSTVMLRRQALEAVGGFDPRLHAAQDWDVWLRVAALGPENLRVEQVLCQYRVHAGGLSNDYAGTFVAGARVLREHRRSARRRGDRVAEAAASLGLRELRLRSGAQAYDRARAARRDRRLGPTVGHLVAAGALAPRYTATSAWRKVAG
jgi:glycosyltransferase involved in cell wall biosynthesis